MDAGPVSLYLDLEPGRKADLEVVSRAALAFTAAVNELAYIIDPSVEVRIEFISGTEGSLSLNSLFRAVKQLGSNKYTIPACIATVLVWFASDIQSTLVGDVVNHVIGIDRSDISDADAQKITEIVKKAIAEKVAHEQVAGVYRALESDSAVKGVGSTTESGTRPSRIVPREQFPSRAGLLAPSEVAIDKRVKTERMTLTLVSPVLVPSLTRRWRFNSPTGPISAPIKDVRFLSRLLSGQERVQMRANIEMDVLLETSEEKRDGVWVVTDRSILQVTGVRRAATQADLFSTPAEEDDEEDK